MMFPYLQHVRHFATLCKVHLQLALAQVPQPVEFPAAVLCLVKVLESLDTLLKLQKRNPEK
jgi:hypothetical protein